MANIQTQPRELTNQRNTDRVRSMLRQNEGFRSDVFRDTEGKRTVGIGFNIDDPAIARFVPLDVRTGKRELSEQEAQGILQRDLLPIAVADAKTFIGDDTFNTLDPARQAVLVDLSFNLGGPRLSTFKKLKSAIQKGNFDEAAKELLDSRYATQVPNRARRNAEILLRGGQ